MSDIVIQLLPHILAALVYAALGFHFWNTRWRESEHQCVACPMKPWERAAIAIALVIHAAGLYGALFTEADLAVTASQLPFNVNSNNPTGGFMLPITVGVAFGYAATNNGLDFCTPKYCTLAQMWLPSNTNIGDVGYTAPASTVVPGFTDQYNWSQSGYITIADGSCWGVNLGRNYDKNGTISFEQQPLGSACAA